MQNINPRMPQRIRMVITTHTAIIVTFNESLLCFLGTSVVVFGIVSVVEVVGEFVMNFVSVTIAVET